LDRNVRALLFACLGAAALGGGIAASGLGDGPRAQVAAATYREHIAPILAAKCIGGHSPGGTGPFSLTSYAEVKPRADLILKAMYLRSMPPTGGMSDFGFVPEFPPLTNEEGLALQSWWRAGVPEGGGPEPKLADGRRDWRLGPPDLVLKSRADVFVPAEGPKSVRVVNLDLPIAEAKTLVAFDVRPATPRAARYGLVAIESGGDANTFSPWGVKAERLVGAWAIGYPAWKLPEDAGIPLKPGSRLAVRMLYHPTGKREDAGFEVALYFSKSPRPLAPKWLTLGKREFVIPGDPIYTTLQDSMTLESSRRTRVVGIVPEARNAAITATVSVESSRSPKKTLLYIPNWDARWIGAFNFGNAPELPLGAKLAAEIQYDNSTHDPDLSLDEARRLPPNPPIFAGPTEANELFWVHVQVLQEAAP